jgi:hypothetical protein
LPLRITAVSLLFAAVSAVFAQSPGARPTSTLVLPEGTRLEMELPQRTALHKVGQTIVARLTAPVYADNRLALPVGTEVEGRVAKIHGAKLLTRVQDGMGGDFSPAPKVDIQFSQVELADGTWKAIATRAAPEGPPLHMVSSAPAKTGKVAGLEKRLSAAYHQQEDAFENLLKEQTKWQTVKSEFVGALPYRPAAIAAGSAYSVKLTAPVVVTSSDPGPAATAPLPAALPEGLVLHARLQETLNSQTTKWGAPVVAIIKRPVLDNQGRLLIPQGSRLEGHVVEVHPAKRWGRAGVLRFMFTGLQLPQGAARTVHTQLQAAATSQPMTMDREGGVTATPPGGKSAEVALAVTALATVKGDADNAWTMNAGSGTHLRIWGTAMAVLLARARPLALGLGFVGSGRTIYRRWIGPGPAIVFPKHTELVIRITPKAPHGPALKR